MATYVPGSEQYLPDIKPFTPDYKFLSAVLDTRQGKYNTNWQATNDIYNKVVYADLSRKDTTATREQYVNNLAPSLEKIAGMDLSLAQNAQSAKAVFAPFFEDELLLKDRVKTANYRKQMAYAGRLARSVDPEQRDLWWVDGERELQYRMQDFINMSPEEALDAPVYKYTPDADLGKLASRMLGEMKPPLKMTYDHFGTNPDVINDDGTITKGKVNGDWIITTTNGEIVTGPALAAINERLADDPRVQKAYRTQAYVAGRDFAQDGIDNGGFATVQEGQNAWANATIKIIEENNNKDITDGTKNLAVRKQSTVRWSNYKELTGVIPGSDDEKIMDEAISEFDSVSAILQNKLNVRDVIKNESPDLESNLNRAYQLLMMTNLQTDMLKAAKAFSMRDYKSTMRETAQAKDKRKFIYDSALEEGRSRNRRSLAFDLETKRNENAILLAIAKGEINPQNNILNDELNKTGLDRTDPKALSFNLEDENKIVEASTDQYFMKKDLLRTPQIKSILSFTNQLSPSVGEVQATTAITIKNKNTGKDELQELTPTELESFLTEKEYDRNGKDIGYKNIKAIDDLFSKYRLEIQNKDEIEKRNVSFVNTGTGYTDLLEMFNTTENNLSITEMNQTTARQIQKDNYDDTTEILLGTNDNVKGLLEFGMPSLWYKDKNEKGEEIGRWKKYNKNEYIEVAYKLAQQGKLKNFDRAWSVDTGEDTSDYMEGKKTFVKRSGSRRPSMEISKTEFEVNKAAVRDDATYAYDALQEANNEGLRGTNPELQTATFNSIDQRISNSTAALSNYGVIKAEIDAEIRNPKAEAVYAMMLKQRRIMKEDGKSPTFFITDIENAAEEGAIAEEVFDMFNANFNSYSSNNKTSSNVKETPRGRFVYGAVYGDPEDGTKTTAGYTFYPNEEYLDSKVKGGGGDSQYAGLTNEQRLNIKKNGITMLFEQSEDISPGALKQQRNNSSIVAATIESKGGYWHQNVVVEEGAKGGEFTWTKINKDSYRLNYELETYVPSKNGVGGNYVKNGAISTLVNINSAGSIYGGSMSILEKQQKDMLKIIQAQGIKNGKAKNKDVATYKSSNLANRMDSNKIK